MNCKNCKSTGWVESEIYCSRPAAQCCGGCTAKFECHICQGYGYLTPDSNDDFAHYLDVLIERMKVRIILFKGYVSNFLSTGEINLSDKYANRVDSCEKALKRLEELYYNHIEKRRS